MHATRHLSSSPLNHYLTPHQSRTVSTNTYTSGLRGRIIQYNAEFGSDDVIDSGHSSHFHHDVELNSIPESGKADASSASWGKELQRSRVAVEWDAMKADGKQPMMSAWPCLFETNSSCLFATTARRRSSTPRPPACSEQTSEQTSEK